MKDRLDKLKNTVIEFFNVGQPVEVANKQQDILTQVREAHKEWQIALNNYNYCIDRDFIDYSIYNIEAAEKKYVYLMKMARRENLTVNIPTAEFLVRDAGSHQGS